MCPLAFKEEMLPWRKLRVFGCGLTESWQDSLLSVQDRLLDALNLRSTNQLNHSLLLRNTALLDDLVMYGDH